LFIIYTPVQSEIRIRRAIERAIALNGIKELAVVFQFVYLTRGSGNTFKSSFAFRIRPTLGADIDS
jgi:hypothetical protein